VVVLPLPFAPRNPQISPAATWSLKPSTTFSLPKLLRNPADVDDVVPYGGPAAGVIVTCRPGSSGAAFVFGGRRFGEKDELAAVRFGISEGGVYLAYGAMKEMVPPRSAGQLSRSNATFWPCGARELGLRNEEAHEDLFPGAAATPPVLRPPASRPGCRDVGDDSCVGRDDRALIQTPFGLIQCGLKRIDHRRLSRDFRRPAQLGLAQSSTPTSKVRYCAADPLALGRAPERREDSLEPGLSRRS
jgi:hypothetical protein